MNKNLNDLKKEYLEIEVSTKVNKNIEKTLSSLSNIKSDTGRNFKKVASIIGVITTSVLLIFALNSDLVIASITSIFSKFNNSEVINENTEKYSEPINYVADSNGKKLNIKDVIFSPKGISFTFSIDKSFIESSMSSVNGSDNNKAIEKLTSVYFEKGITISSILIDGSSIFIDDIVGKCIIGDDGNNLIGYQHITLDSLKNGEKITIIIDKIGNIFGEWKLDFTVDMKVKQEDIFVLDNPVVRESADGNLVVEEIIQTPLYTHVIYTLEGSSRLLYAMILDENGRDIRGEGLYGYGGKNLGGNKIRFSSYLKNKSNGINKLTFIPYPIAIDKKSGGKTEWKFLKGDEKLPFEINLGKRGNIRINSIEENSTEVKVNCDILGDNKDLLVNSLGLSLKTSEEVVNDPNIISNFNPIWVNQDTYDKLTKFEALDNITLVFDKYPGKEGYVLVYSTRDIETIESLRTEIKIK